MPLIWIVCLAMSVLALGALPAQGDDIIITELMVNPAAVPDSFGEWFEIYNNTASQINLNGWIIRDLQGSDVIEGDVFMSPGQYFVFCVNGNLATNGGVPTDYDYLYGTQGSGLAFSNSSNDQIVIYNNLGQLQDSVYFNYPAWAGQAGRSFELKSLSYDNNIDSSWCIAQNSWSGSQGDKGTPGELNDCVTTEHYLMVQSPNGYEEWHVMQHDTVRWIGVGFEGGVKIELNRSYPSSTWEILVNSTENDSEEAVFVADLLSDQCRVKVSALEDTLFDISDGDFSIKGPLYGGAVSGIWTADYSPVYICDNATVASDDTLIIEPGVIVEFLGHYQFTVNGLLLAIGTEQDPIIFTTDTLINPPRWGGLTFSGSSSSQSQLAYCVIEHVDRSSFVGGVYCHNASPTFANCIISGNSTNGYGGGIYCENNSDPHFTACTISGNQADYDGGGIYCYDSSPVFIDCIISGNRAAFSGGGIFSAYASPSFSNCTVTSNSAFYGGGIACWYGNALSATNTIIWGNCAVCAGDELYLHDAGSSIAFHCCDVDSSGINGEGTLIWLEGNIFGDPLFCNPDTCDNAPTTAGDYHIYDVSPCAPAQQSECTLIGALNAGCSRAPMPVGDLTIAVQAVDATLFWSPVADTMSGNPVQVDFYLIFYSQYPEGPYFFRGATADTCYTHSGAVQFADAMFYQVTAYVGSIGFLEKALAELGEHPKREDLNSRLQKPFAGKR